MKDQRRREFFMLHVPIRTWVLSALKKKIRFNGARPHAAIVHTTRSHTRDFVFVVSAFEQRDVRDQFFLRNIITA